MALKLKPLKRSSPDELLEHQRLTSLVNSMADAVIAVDAKAKVVLYNASALNIMDVNTIPVGSSLAGLCDLVDKEGHPVDLDALVAGVSVPTTNRDLRMIYKDGSLINLYISIAPVHLGYGEQGSSGFVLMLRDITREKSLEEERDEFISVVSHELRTPIAISEGSISNAELVSERSGDMSIIRKALKDAHNQILFLGDMINDLSTLSRAERGKLEVSIDSINVHEMMQSLAANYAAQAESKGLKIKLDLDEKLELLKSSKLYVQEILQNFITNSIKYTQEGSITLKATCADKGVRFEIQDTGIGISKSDQERVFDKFFRSEDFRTRKNNGTGLGLYVTMKLTRLLHADLDLQSELNKGSTFSIFIPDLEANVKN